MMQLLNLHAEDGGNISSMRMAMCMCIAGRDGNELQKGVKASGGQPMVK